jgi:putative transposase
MERFWRTLKYGDVYLKSYNTIKEAREGIDEYIMIYNSERLHFNLWYQTPDEAYYLDATTNVMMLKKHYWK